VTLIHFAGAFSEFMIARGSRRAIWSVGVRTVAGLEGFLIRRGVLGIVGLGLTGWGLVFLAGGLIFEVWVVLLTPDALQKHVQNSYFGKGGDASTKYKTLAEEDAGVRALTEPAAPAQAAPQPMQAAGAPSY
jgi:hypothetical protein